MNTHRKLNEDTLLAFFSRLGDTAEAIRLKLHKMGVRGYIQNGQHCPLAYVASRHFGVPIRVSGICRSQDSSVVINTTRACREFISDFDAKKYPELIKED